MHPYLTLDNIILGLFVTNLILSCVRLSLGRKNVGEVLGWFFAMIAQIRVIISK